MTDNTGEGARWEDPRDTVHGQTDVTLTITDEVMRSTDTPHTARLVGTRPGHLGAWRVSWLPERALTRNEAISAMSIAEWVGQIPADAGPESYSETFWVNVDGWAAELGLTGPDAVARASGPPS